MLVRAYRYISILANKISILANKTLTATCVLLKRHIFAAVITTIKKLLLLWSTHYQLLQLILHELRRAFMRIWYNISVYHSIPYRYS
jgi:hypothetical protein